MLDKKISSIFFYYTPFFHFDLGILKWMLFLNFMREIFPKRCLTWWFSSMETTITTRFSFKYTVKKKVILLTFFQLPTVTTRPTPGKWKIQNSFFSLPEDALLAVAQEITGWNPTNFIRKWWQKKICVSSIECSIFQQSLC